MGLITSPFLFLSGSGNSSLFTFYFESLSTDSKRSNYYATVDFSNSYLRLPNTLEYAGATINVYVRSTSAYGLKVTAGYLLNKTSYTIAVGQMVELVCVSTETTFIGWYLKE